MAQIIEYNNDTVSTPVVGSNSHVVRSKVDFADKLTTSQHYSIKLVTRGKERYFLHGQSVRLSNNDYLLIKPGTTYSALVNKGDPAEGLCLYYTPAEVRGVCASMLNTTANLMENHESGVHSEIPWPEMKRGTTTQKVGSLFQQIIQKTDKQLAGGFNNLDDCLLVTLLENMLAENLSIRQQINKMPQIKETVRQEALRRLHLSVELMHSDCYRQITLSELAFTASLSVFHYSRLFRQVYGYPPCQYLQQIRIEKAGRDLLSTLLPVGEIALACGFNDHASFCRVFRQTTGQTPLQYRNSKN